MHSYKCVIFAVINIIAIRIHATECIWDPFGKCKCIYLHVVVAQRFDKGQASQPEDYKFKLASKNTFEIIII